MHKDQIASVGSRAVVVMDSITAVAPEDEDKIVVSGSHGGTVSGEYASRHRLAAVFFNDAGVGKEGAGIAALEMLERNGVPAGTVANHTARIGDALDHWQSGVLSHVNNSARALGIRDGDPLQAAIEHAFSKP